MKIQGAIKRVTERMGDIIEEQAERIVNSSIMERIEEHMIGNDYMPRGTKRYAVKKITIEGDQSDRLCKCPEPIEGSIVNRIQYCAVCQGVMEVIS